MIEVAGYCRVSTDKDDQVNSFHAQKEYFRAYIEQRTDWKLYEIYADEGITGTSTKKRTQFNQMIHDAHAGKFQLILTKEVSRFSRNILDTIAYTRQLKAVGVAVIFLTDGINTMDPDAELRLSIMASIAQEESRRTSSRVVWGQTRQMEKGVVFGQSMLGYDVRDGKMTVNPEGAEIVRMIFHKYALEGMGTTAIARFLEQSGFRTYRGNGNWKANGVVKILKNEKYVGDLVQKKSYTPDYLTHEKRRNTGQVPLVRIENHHEGIIDRDLWNLVQARLQRNNKHGKTKAGHSNRYGFSGKIKCGECGANFVARFKYRKDGTRIRRWSCASVVQKGGDGCSIGRLIRDDDAMQMLFTAIGNVPVDLDSIVCDVVQMLMDTVAQSDVPRRIHTEMDRIQIKTGKMLDSYFAGEITKEDMQTMKQHYAEQLEILQERLTNAEEKLITDPSRIKEEMMSILEGKTESETFCKTMLHSVTVYQDRHLELRLNGLPVIFCFQ